MSASPLERSRARCSMINSIGDAGVLRMKLSRKPDLMIRCPTGHVAGQFDQASGAVSALPIGVARY